MTPATSDAGRVVPITDRIEWLELFSDRGQHKRIPGPSAGDAWELAQELKPLAATLSALQRKLDAVGELVADLETSQISSNLGSLYAAGAAAGLRHAIDRMRALLGGDGEVSGG